jgi:hypothetical protein
LAAQARSASSTPQTQTSGLTSEQETKARATLRHLIAQDEATWPTPSAPAPAKPKSETSKPPKETGKKPTPSPKPAPNETQKKPIEATIPASEVPTVALPRSRQQQLDELLRAYKADLITPGEYHRQRAKILSEPDK